MRISDWSSDVCSSDLRARLPLPARVVVGTYTAETFLIQDGRVLAAAVREIEVHKSGFERFVAKAADEWSIFYVLTAIAFALGMVWDDVYLFRRHKQPERQPAGAAPYTHISLTK